MSEGITLTQSEFGTLPDGSIAELYCLKNPAGMEARITNYGGILVSLLVPDSQGTVGDIVLGYDTLDAYVADTCYFGCIAGRYAGRIAGGRFTLEGTPYTLSQNEGMHHLHGGVRGFNKVLWDAQPILTAGGPALKLTYLSPDGEEGYPGNVRVQAVYSLNARNELAVELQAMTDRLTIVNLTHHAYFNLSGAADILDHELRLHADAYLPIDAHMIPTGAICPTKGTPMDFSRRTRLRAAMDARYDQIRMVGGYDHTWVIQGPHGTLRPAAEVFDPRSGRSLEVWSTAPGLQFYSGNFLQSVPGKRGEIYGKHAGLCLEPQHFPDAPHHPAFPSAMLTPGHPFTRTIAFCCRA